MEAPAPRLGSSSTLLFPRGPAARIRAAFAALPPNSERTRCLLIHDVFYPVNYTSSTISQQVMGDAIDSQFTTLSRPLNSSSPFRRQCHPIYSRVNSRSNSNNAHQISPSNHAFAASDQCDLHHPQRHRLSLIPEMPNR